ncbi:MAG: DDE-type integrase/transposase/recombinase [Methylococcaceae bacterium]|nr:DDE-type integrase/transposase/recombinase [Methylococcaceae bacterium]
MSQSYHTNAKTNMHSREIIQQSNFTNTELAERFEINEKTVFKWKNRDHLIDKSSRPHTIKRSLTDLEREVVRVVRTLTWIELDDLVDSVLPSIPKANRSNVYRTLRDFDVNRVPEEKKEQAKKFKEYEPGYLHIDVTYLPKLEGIKYYLYVAIDRATRLMYFKVYKNKTARNAVDFLNQCKSYFPFYMSYVLTDNGAEFTDKFTSRKNKASGNHAFDIACIDDHIDHRLTAPFTPKTNGMVERVNGTIKDATIKVLTYKNETELKADLDKFLVYYNLNRRHCGLKRELKVRTPFEALQCWYRIKPEIFRKSSDMFRAELLKNHGTTW